MSLSGGFNPLDFPHHKLSPPAHFGSYPIFTPADFHTQNPHDNYNNAFDYNNTY